MAMRIPTAHPMNPTAVINLMTYPMMIANPTAHPMNPTAVISNDIPRDDRPPNSPPHVPQPPPLKRRKFELDPPRHRNQFAYELMLSLREEQYARKRSASNNQSKTTIDIDTCTTITLPPKRL